MRRWLAFLGLLAPYLGVVVACVVLGAAFVVPDATFEAVGSTGLVAATVLGTASLLVAFRTDRSLVAAARRLHRARSGRETDATDG